MALDFPTLTALLVLLASIAEAASKPNIVLIIADDLGFNDVSFRGSNQIPTPNIDALAYNGIVLDRHYVLPTCTPSRTALLTGQYPVRTGMQGFPIYAGEPRGLPLELQLLPQHLTRLGYATYLVGKWHQGMHQSEYLPTRRGFHHHLGYWNGMISYYDHMVSNGFDMHWDEQPAWHLQGRYATHLFTERAEDIIAHHDSAAGPLYLQVAHLAAHTGLNGTELEVPDEADTDQRFSYIRNEFRRRRLAGVMREMDLSVGRIVKALQKKGMLHNSIVIFMSDNGAETLGMFQNGGSNWPLRGQKSTLYEGGVRGAAALWSALLAKPRTLHTDLIHLTDWLPTFYEAAGGNVADLGRIDGVSQWGLLTGASNKNARSETLVQINEAGAIIQDNWKLIRGQQRSDRSIYLGDSGRGGEVPEYDVEAVLRSPTAQALAATASAPLTASTILSLRAAATIPATCRPDGEPALDVTCDPYCLFDVFADPCESNDVRESNQDVGDKLLRRLQYWDSLAVPKLNLPVDPASDPRMFNGTWSTWLDAPSGANKPRDLMVLCVVTLLCCIFVRICVRRLAAFRSHPVQPHRET